MSERTIQLFYREGSSDKIYYVEIVRCVSSKYVVNFCYGRRNGASQYGTKTKTPVSEAQADSIFDNLVQEKKAKGYTENPSGEPYATHVAAPVVKQKSKKPTPITIAPQIKTPDGSFQPQLLNPIDESSVNIYIQDDAWMAQEKIDGKRISIVSTIVKGKTQFTAYNRKGLVIHVPDCFAYELAAIPYGFQMDGEQVEDNFLVFDILSANNEDLKESKAIDRWRTLSIFLGMIDSKHVSCVASAFTTTEKQAMYNTLVKKGKEGIVFKHKNALYHPGRPASGGSQVKCKFYKTASVVVIKTNQKSSVEVGVFENGKLISVGNVTIPPNKKMPTAGSFVEVRYLYAYKGGCLYQPTYLQDRTDEIDASACVISQLAYKNEPVTA